MRFGQSDPPFGRHTRIAEHLGSPFSKSIPSETLPNEETLGDVAHDYLNALNEYLIEHGHEGGLRLPPGWLEALAPGASQGSEISWLPVWPPLEGGTGYKKPRLASWNLSRGRTTDKLHTAIVLVASEVYATEPAVYSNSIGLRVPMTVEKQENGEYQVSIRSMTAELPGTRYISGTEILSGKDQDTQNQFLIYIRNFLVSKTYLDALSNAEQVDPETIFTEEIRFMRASAAAEAAFEFGFETVAKARGSLPRFPEPLSYQVISEFRSGDQDSPPQLVRSRKIPLVTSAGPGWARIFEQVPPAFLDPDEPDDLYDWSSRRPTRSGQVLDSYRVPAQIANERRPNLSLDGFTVRLCPGFVPGDKGQPGDVKKVDLPANQWPDVRRNDFSAISAFYNSHRFFEMMSQFDIDFDTFVVAAEPVIQIYYRSGIIPGPGKNGQTINAQVRYDCKAATPPSIDMHLAVGNLTRRARPLNANHDPAWAQPLGIATSGRWMMHEFGHYLLAARIGQLEFDFAHSAGDAMAAVYFDPMSRVADRRGEVPPGFRGITYPFVFSTRRHDRSVLLGWAWYGALNRSVLDNPSSDCCRLKGYLTEQILSTTVFRLYRSLGGDTMRGDAPDRYVRRRASHMTLFLLLRAIQAMAQSPSVAEMLEEGMEEASSLMDGPLAMPIQPTAPPPMPDYWQEHITQKTVRWAFEAQGMFPENAADTLNRPGRPLAVDLYVKDRRPEFEATKAGRVAYLPGAYTPVSLDWGGASLWQSDRTIVLGNRGYEEASSVTLRVWIGVASGDPSDSDWHLTEVIEWREGFGPIDLGSLPAETHNAGSLPEMTGPLAAFDALPGDLRLLLVEVSCPSDRANTSPATLFAVSVPDGELGLKALPKIPRQLTDLVANDNNLGLHVHQS